MGIGKDFTHIEVSQSVDLTGSGVIRIDLKRNFPPGTKIELIKYKKGFEKSIIK